MVEAISIVGVKLVRDLGTIGPVLKSFARPFFDTFS